MLGWDAWRKYDQENSTSVLQTHIEDLNAQGFLRNNVDTKLMTYSISGALNELALQYSQYETFSKDDPIICIIEQLVIGFKKDRS